MTDHVHDLSVAININEVPDEHMDEVIEQLRKLLEPVTEMLPDCTLSVDDGRKYCDEWAEHYGVSAVQ